MVCEPSASSMTRRSWPPGPRQFSPSIDTSASAGCDLMINVPYADADADPGCPLRGSAPCGAPDGGGRLSAGLRGIPCGACPGADAPCADGGGVYGCGFASGWSPG